MDELPASEQKACTCGAREQSPTMAHANDCASVQPPCSEERFKGAHLRAQDGSKIRVDGTGHTAHLNTDCRVSPTGEHAVYRRHDGVLDCRYNEPLSPRAVCDTPLSASQPFTESQLANVRRSLDSSQHHLFSHDQTREALAIVLAERDALRAENERMWKLLNGHQRHQLAVDEGHPDA